MLRTTLCALALVSVIPAAQARGHHHSHGHHGTPWCGIYLSHYLGKQDRNLALARNWAREGAPAPGPGVGVVAVWPHHVGIITGQAASGSCIPATTAMPCGRGRARSPASLPSAT